MAEIGTAYVKIEPTAVGISGKITQEMGSAGESGGKAFGAGFGKVIGATGAVVAGAVAAGTAAVGGFATSSLQAGQTFDSAMSQVAATMGKTTAEIGDLRDFAQEMGSTTAFSASQAADALNYMALAGYDAETSMKMLPNVLNLAAAGGIELAQASDMVTDAQTALGLSLDETSTMVDQMAKASSISNTSVQQLGDAMLQVGANARSVKGGTQEIATVLGVMADNSIKGAEAGTHLRNIMLAMNPTTDKAANAWEALGVQAWDAEGNLRDLPSIFMEINQAMDGMTNQQRDEMLSAMFNKTDLAAVKSLIGTTAERYDQLSTSIEGASGAAEAMAKTQLENLAGDVIYFKSALEGVQIALSDQLSPTLRDFVKFGTDSLSELTLAFKEGGLDGAMAALNTILADGINMIITKLPRMIEVGKELIGALGQGLLSNMGAITQAAVDIILMLTQFLLSSLPEIANAALQIIAQLATGLAQALPTLIPQVVDVILQIVQVLTSNADLLVDGAIALMIGLANGLAAAIPILTEKAPEIVLKLLAAIIMNLPKIMSAGTEICATIASGIIRGYAGLIKAGGDIIGKIGEGLKGLMKVDVIQWGKDLIDNFVSGIKKNIGKLVDAAKDIGKTIKDYIGFSEPKLGPLSNFHTFAPDMMDLFAEGIKENENVVSRQMAESLSLPTVQPAPQTSSSSVNATLNIYGTEGQDVNELAEVVMDKINSLVYKQGAVYA